MFSQLHRLQKRDLPIIAEKMGRAFEDDPICRYIFPHEAARRKHARYFYEFVMRTDLRAGELYAPSPELEGVAGWLPPGGAFSGTWDYIMAGAVQTAWRVGAGAMRRIDFIGKELTRRHRLYAPEPHYYLSLLGTDPELKGRGFAGQLMRPMLARCDDEGMGIYLETHNPVNPAIYRRFGFEIMDESPIAGTDMVQWSMLRRP